MGIKVEQRPAIWVVRVMWFFSGALVMDATGFLLKEIFNYKGMNTGGAVLTLIAGIFFVYLSIKWDNQLLQQIQEEN